MLFLIPIGVSLATAALYVVYLRFIRKAQIGAVDLIPYGLGPVAVILYELVTLALGYGKETLGMTIAACGFTLAVCAYLRHRHIAPDDQKRSAVFVRRFSLAVVILILLEMSVFQYSSYSAPRGGELALSLDETTYTNMDRLTADALTLCDDEDSVADWSIPGTDVSNITLTLRTLGGSRPVTVNVWAKDRNFSTRLMALNTATEIIPTEGTIYLPLSSRGMTDLYITLGMTSGVYLTGVSLNAPKPLSVNLLRLGLLTALTALILWIAAYRLHRVSYRAQSKNQRLVIMAAALICCFVLTMIGTAHGAMLTPYDGVAEGRDPYYQTFDAFQKGQLNLDLPVDERLSEIGELAYDSGYLADEGIVEQWDRAFYNGKYYSYFGLAPLMLCYYPVYWITGMVPSTALVCVFLSVLFVIFGFLFIFRLARSVVQNANFLLTLLSAAVLPLAGGIFILTAYGDFYNLPKLCALAFLMLLYYLTICGYERPRWYIFLLCGLCVGVILASRPNLVLAAAATAPLYIAVLARRTLSIKHKIIDVAAFLLPIAAIGAALMWYNAARFGSPFEFGSKYQLTVNNIAMNNLSLGFLGMAIYHYFFQLPDISPVFPFIKPWYHPLETYTRYMYIIMSFGTLSLPLNWSLAAYPAVRRRSGLKREYRWTLGLSLVMCVMLALTDFALGGLTISYVCDIAAEVAVAAILVMLVTEKASRKYSGVHKGVYIGACILLAGTIFACVMLLLGTEPYFVRNSMPDVYSAIRGVFRF